MLYSTLLYSVFQPLCFHFPVLPTLCKMVFQTLSNSNWPILWKANQNVTHVTRCHHKVIHLKKNSCEINLIHCYFPTYRTIMHVYEHSSFLNFKVCIMLPCGVTHVTIHILPLTLNIVSITLKIHLINRKKI